jgi:putative membrane protein
MFDRAPVYLATLPNFVIYFVASLALTAIFLLIYTRVTPYREWALIRAGNNAAAISLSGAGLGFVLPLASTIVHSVNWLDMIIWGVIAMLIQLGTYLIARLLKPQLNADISAGRTAPAVSLAGMSVGVGILNAACLTW